jgi:hypothetical protein
MPILAILAGAAAIQMPTVMLDSYPVPMLDVDGSSKYIAVVTSHDRVEVRRCQHMVWTGMNYLSCEFNDGEHNYNVVIPIVRSAVDVRQPYGYMVAPGTK